MRNYMEEVFFRIYRKFLDAQAVKICAVVEHKERLARLEREKSHGYII